MNAIIAMLSDINGQPSTMRVSMLLVVGVVMAVWAYICVKQAAFVELPDTILGLLGIVFGGKVVQRMSEKPITGAGEVER